MLCPICPIEKKKKKNKMSEPKTDDEFDKEFVDMVTSEEWDFPIPFESVETLYVEYQPPQLFMMLPTPIEIIQELIEKWKRGNEDGDEFS